MSGLRRIRNGLPCRIGIGQHIKLPVPRYMDRLEEALNLLGVGRALPLDVSRSLMMAIQSFALASGDFDMAQACEAKMVQFAVSVTASSGERRAVHGDMST